MRFAIKFLLLAAIAFLIARLSFIGPGHVIIFISRYRIDLSLTTMVLIIALIFLAIYYLTRLWVNINRIPNKIRRYQAKHALLESRKDLNNAGVHYFEGKFHSAYLSAMKSINKEISKDNKFIAYMLAFKSASYLRNYDKQDELLTELDKYKERKWQLAKLMALAESQYAEQKYGICLDNLYKILDLDKKHVPSRRIMLKVYLHINNYEKAFEVLNWLTKHDALEKVHADSYKVQALQGLFKQQNDISELNYVYQKLEKADRQNLWIVKLYFNALIRLGQYAAALDFAKSVNNAELVTEAEALSTQNNK